jgi:hypothetical protein
MMMEKKSIIDEMFAQARIYLEEIVEMKIQTIQDYDSIPENCPKCNHELKEIYCRPEDLQKSFYDYDLIVLKCEKCNRFLAFWIESESYDNELLTPSKEDEQIGGRIIELAQWKNVGKPQWGEGKKPTFLKKCAEAYVKETSDPNNLNERLNRLINTKLRDLQQAGIGLETINLARNKVINHSRNKNPPAKNLTILLAAAVYATANGITTNRGLWQHQGESISERQLEKIFDVSRKTIRKWEKTFTSDF